MARATSGALLPVLMQDPAVAGETESRNIIQPVPVRDEGGFVDGPACSRVAIVDLDFQTGKLGPPVQFNPTGSPYKGIGSYRVTIPKRQGGLTMPWSRGEGTFDLSELAAMDHKDPFLKVSVFGTVLRVLGLIQDPAVLGREVRWAFPGRQLLVVPRAGELDNAFYHRGSHSLQFYYGSGANSRIYSALSQDIVAHEATHAVVDGIASDLYDAISPESLAIHEGLADITAAILSTRNREKLPPQASPEKELRASSRFSRIAEEFGRWRGHGEALRDVCNTKTLSARSSSKNRVDASSPHALSAVLSGLLYFVFRNVHAHAGHNPNVLGKIKGHRFEKEHEGPRLRMIYSGNRVLSLIYRGLDWLPPGDAGFGDLVQAMVAADRLFLPKDDFARRVLLEEAARRQILLSEQRTVRNMRLDPAADPRTLLESLRGVLDVPANARVKVTIRRFYVYEPPIEPRSTSELFTLTPVLKPAWTLPANEHVLVKLAWWHREPNDLGPSWGNHRRYRTGATVVLDRKGNVRALLRNRTDSRAPSRSAFLKRLCADDPERQDPRIGPDGAPLGMGPRLFVRGDTLGISGAMEALHLSGDETWIR